MTYFQIQTKSFATAGQLFVSALLLFGCNLHLFGLVEIFNPLDYCIARPQLFTQWWRIVLHPFVHVSWLHLLLDVGAVALLWQSMPKGELKRVAIVFFCAMTGLFCALLFSSDIGRSGLCGLSGAAHGMAACIGGCWLWTPAGESVPQVSNKNVLFRRVLGGVLLGVVLLKSVVETVTGGGIFADFYHGALGVVIVHAHLGGTLGGGAVAAVFSLGGKKGTTLFRDHRYKSYGREVPGR